MADSISTIRRDVIACARCPALRRYCQRIARIKRRAYRDQTYWGRPVPGFGDPAAKLLIIGLAPAAHGGNRTGRVFTGDRSGDFLFAALHRAGLANQPTSTGRDDGLQLKGAYITAALHCAPPGNKPKPAELDRCRGYLIRELQTMKRVRAVLALGTIAFDEYLKTLRRMGRLPARPRLIFEHGGSYILPGPRPLLFAAYHPSQQNTQTGRLTAAMFDCVLADIARIIRL
ncbi:MAG TPA: uracil-DNA glycosylase [Nitrospiria bacterium]|nr:uracil-DNA glycosylase [Nitrospiria bacterium]